MITFQDLEYGLNESGFTLNICRIYRTYKVTPTSSKTPVYKFGSLLEVRAFHTGIEAQKRLANLS